MEPSLKQPAAALSGNRGYDFSNSLKYTNTPNYKFTAGQGNSNNTRTVDQTLANLFETLTVECSGILVHPQWKHFRHIHMLKNDQIRLSNGIWRSWHMQFLKRRDPLYCRFDIDFKLLHHQRQEAVVLEGKYWKRKVEAVATEYRKWRIHYRDYNKNRKTDPSMKALQDKAKLIFDEMCGDHVRPKPQAMQVDTTTIRPSFIQGFDAEFPETLLTHFTKDSPEPFTYSTDIMMTQPNLDMLNPTLEDFLDKLEPMEVMLSRGISSSMPSSAPQPPFFLTGPSYPPPPQQQTSFQPQQQPLATPLQQTTDQSNSALLNQLTAGKPLPPQNQQQQYYSPSAAFTDPQQQNTFATLSPTNFLSMSQQTPPPPPTGFKGRSDSSMDITNVPLKQESLTEQGSFAMATSDQYGPAGGYQQQRGDYIAMGGAGGRVESPGPVYMSQKPLQQQQSVAGQQQQQDPLLNQYMTPETSPQVQRSPVLSQQQQQQRLMEGGDVFQFPAQSRGQGSPYENSSPPQQQRDMPPPSHPPPFNRVSSAGDLISSISAPPPERPPLARGSSEPIRRLKEQVQILRSEHEQQMVEIERQNSVAQKQYVDFLQQLLQRQASGKTSEQQQRVLQSVLSDPNLVSILRDILLTATPLASSAAGAEPTAGARGVSLRSTSVPTTPQSKPSLLPPTPPPLSQVLSPPPDVVSPQLQQPTKSLEMSDFQSRLLMAATTSQTTHSNSFGSPFPSLAFPTPGTPIKLQPSFQSPESDTSLLAMHAQKKFKNARHLSSEEKEVYREIRRQSHISAEQKRRGSIKHGFDQLQSLVVNLSAYPSGKVSKATILEKTLEHIHHSHHERDERERQTEALKREIEELNVAIMHCQEQLPASGAPVTRQRFQENRQRFVEYVQRRTQQNYKFWIFGIILKQLFDSYNSMVSTGSVDELCRTVLAWFEQYCSLPSLRPVVMNSLRELSQRTTILTDPSRVPHQLAQYAQQDQQQNMATN